ncbi:ATP-binding protein [Cypionkella sp.]|uniref:sensor histidine kinase n=1 Tax=Cypionkella sp. TaxID=2811411 RepID=UPI00260DC914|nr:ATP-binding protein [Cypionkella sp.]MDB5666521.1 two-component sensor histidine kinase [Cypionkella sp.]
MDNEALRALLGGLPLPVMLIGADERIVQANAAATALFGPAILDRHHALSFRQPEFLQAISQALLRGQSGRVRLTLAGAAQDTVYEVTVSPVPQGVLCAFEDRSAWEQMDQMRRDFVANVSHELRTPLTALLGFIETLRGPARNDAPARERFLAIMASEAERMNRLVRDLLHLSRVESEERVVPSDELDIAGLLQASVASLRPVAEAARVKIVIEGADQPLMIRADHDQMTQVLTNLVENAVKYGSRADSQVLVALNMEKGPRGQQLRISVSDQGEGIDPLHIPRLTERFYRVDGHRSREKGGTGLGLAIVKHIVNRHRGRLIIESAKGKGSRFSVLLPYEPR